MDDRIMGLHHITAIAGSAQLNYDFYTKTLGLRLVKKTVNFDDPGTYHFYFGDEVGTPGSILTFFPWEGISTGSTGTGMATEIGFAVPLDSLPFWQVRLGALNVKHQEIQERFGEQYLPLQDPDGLLINLVAAPASDNRKPFVTSDINETQAIRGFSSVVLTVRKLEPTAKVIQDLLGYKLLAQEGNRYSFVTDAINTAHVVDIVENPKGEKGINAAGTNHHVAFRVKDENVLMRFREKISKAGFNITGKIDRNYFYSLYFREPGGILFELATDNPGFATDESIRDLGTHLMLPPQYQAHRDKIEEVLPVLQP